MSELISKYLFGSATSKSCASYGGVGVEIPVLPSEPAHWVDVEAQTDGLHVRVTTGTGVVLVETVTLWNEVKAWTEAATAVRFTHRPDEPKEQQPGESYLTWLQRTLSFARTYGKPNDPEGRAWRCGYCGLGRHADCIIDCGCTETPECGGSLGGFAGHP